MQWPTTRITHVGLNVTDLARAVDFYQRAFGMVVRKRADGRFATLSFGYQHHDIALIPGRAAAAPAVPMQVGLNHVAFEVKDYVELVGYFGRMVDAGIKVERAVDHRTGIGIYTRDPDGNALELWCENFETMERANQFGSEMAEEFEENHIGYTIDMAQLYQDYLKFKEQPSAASEGRRFSYADADV